MIDAIKDVLGRANKKAARFIAGRLFGAVPFTGAAEC
jgi:hypothetical protein